MNSNNTVLLLKASTDAQSDLYNKVTNRLVDNLYVCSYMAPQWVPYYGCPYGPQVELTAKSWFGHTYPYGP